MKLWKSIFLNTTIGNRIFSNISFTDVINVYGAFLGNTYAEIMTKCICAGFGEPKYEGIIGEHIHCAFTDCEICEKILCVRCGCDDNTLFDCHNCWITLCDGCVRECDVCKETTCPKHMKKCSRCGKNICKQRCVKQCSFCDAHIYECEDCIDKFAECQFIIKSSSFFGGEEICCKKCAKQ